MWTFETTWREAGTTADQRARVRNFTDLPQWFKQNNYTTLGTGKTFHPGLPPNYDEPKSWSQDEPYYMAKDAYP